MKMSSLMLPVIMLGCAKANGGNEMLRMCGKALLVALGKICNHNYIEHKSMNDLFEMPPRARRHIMSETNILDTTLRLKRHTRYVRWPYNPVDNCCFRRCTLEYIRKNFCAAPVSGQIDDVVTDVNTLTERTRRHARSNINKNSFNLSPSIQTIFLLHRNNS